MGPGREENPEVYRDVTEARYPGVPGPYNCGQVKGLVMVVNVGFYLGPSRPARTQRVQARAGPAVRSVGRQATIQDAEGGMRPPDREPATRVEFHPKAAKILGLIGPVEDDGPHHAEPPTVQPRRRSRGLGGEPCTDPAPPVSPRVHVAAGPDYSRLTPRCPLQCPGQQHVWRRHMEPPAAYSAHCACCPSASWGG